MGKKLSKEASIDYFICLLTDSPSFGVAEETVALLEHCSQSLLCQAGGAPAPRITWSKNGEVLQNSTSVTYTPRWHSKSGNYTCRASNFNGSDTKTILVHTESEYMLLLFNAQCEQKVLVVR